MFISVTSLCTHQRVLLGGPWRWRVAAGLQTSSSRKSPLQSPRSGTSDARTRRRITGQDRVLLQCAVQTPALTDTTNDVRQARERGAYRGKRKESWS